MTSRDQRLLWDLLHGRERPLDAFLVRPTSLRRARRHLHRMFVDRQSTPGETFPKVLAALGDEEFHRVAARYVDAHPSEHPTSDSWAEVRRVSGAPRPVDLARLEWARGEVLEAARPSHCP